ncbi:endonuclease/exonuclease/phosphatase family protein [Sphingomonas sp. MMS24-JH45]
MRKAIGTDRRRNPERVLQVLDEIGADVVALQEADRRFGQRAAVLSPHLLEEHGWEGGGRRHARAQHGVARQCDPGVRADAEIVACEPVHLPALEPRGAVMVDVRTGGHVFRVVGMHLDLSGLWRRKQAHAILAHVAASTQRLPTVMMGDLNEWSRAAGCLRDSHRLPFRRHRPLVPRPPPDRAARPHHGVARAVDPGVRRPQFAGIAHRVGPSADPADLSS